MMNVSKGILFSSFFRRNGISKRRIGIHSQTQFCKIIKRERAGADRNGHVISLILFHICDTDTNSIEVQDLTCVLLNRIRLLDEVGWFESNRLGVLLPYTSRDGAQKLANDICKAIKIKASSLEYTIYSYPSEWFSNRRRFRSQSNPEHLPSKYKTMMSQNLPNSEENAEDSNRVLENQLSSIDIVSSFRVLEQSIKPFFYSPLPTWKRAFDVVCALLGLIILSPFFLIFALIIKMQSPGPVFFKQKRIGYSGRILTMWKFRTMYCCDNECDHQKYMFSLINSANQKDSFKPMIKQDKHYNITKFGKILRKTSADELPQLINVLHGKMSLVGPRPPTLYEVVNYSTWHYARFDTLPGMTGLWQVSGKNKLTFPEMIQLDIQYIREMSLWKDIVILLKTPFVIASDIKG